MRRALLFGIAALSLLAFSGAARAADVVFNNGNGCIGVNRINDDSYVDDDVYVRNTNCPDGMDPGAACAKPWGAATQVCVLSGADTTGTNVSVHDSSGFQVNASFVGGNVSTHDESAASISGGTVNGSVQVQGDSSLTLSGSGAVDGFVSVVGTGQVTMNGGSTSFLYGYDSSSIDVNDGIVDEFLTASGTSVVNVGEDATVADVYAFDSSSVTLAGAAVVGELWALNTSTVEMTGGQVLGVLWAFNSAELIYSGGWVWGGDLVASDSSTLRVVGREFSVDGERVGYGPLASQSGTLTGTLLGGMEIDNFFYQGGASCPYGNCDGTIVLVESAFDPIPAMPGWGSGLMALGFLGGAIWRLQRSHSKRV